MEKTKILTERLIIRNYEEKDLNDLYEYLSDEEVVRFEPYTAMNLDDVKKNLEWLAFVREGHLRKDIYFRKDKNGNPIWKDTFIYSKLNDRE